MALQGMVPQEVQGSVAVAEHLERGPGNSTPGRLRGAGAPPENPPRERRGGAGEHESRPQEALGCRKESGEIE